MKKNFMAIASLLVAAMLLMVSCAQEVKAPENNGLVEAKLSVGYGRGLRVDGDTETDNIALTYTMSHQWTDSNAAETVVGDKTQGTDSNAAETVVGDKTQETYFTDGGNIGYVTPGLWTVNVFAYAKDKESGKATGNAIFEGTANAYISSQNSSVTVYLAPVDNSTNSITFSITMQDLSATPDNFELKYYIYKGSDSSTITNETGSLDRKGNEATHVSTYSKTVSNLDSGYYRVTVSVYDKTNGKTVGGITTGFLISNNATAEVKGHIEPADYENVTIDAVFVNVNTELSVSQVIQEGESTTENALTKAEGKDYYTVNYEGSPVKVTVKMDDKTTTAKGLTVSKTLFWNTVSDKSETNEKKDIQTANTGSKEFTFTAPGHKYITCTTVYKVTGASTGETTTDYYFADSQTAHVFIDPTNYNDSLNSAK